MNFKELNILLADEDDCLCFKDALAEMPLFTRLTTVHDGEQTMQRLNIVTNIPDILFLDLNMPRKNGFECLSEIKLNKKLENIPVLEKNIPQPAKETLCPLVKIF